MTTTRRDILLGGGAALAATATAGLPAFAQTAPTFTRLSTLDPNLTAKTWQSYATAVQKMLALPPSDGRNWYRQAMIHELDCAHGNWWFVNWHRGYVLRFEQIVREMSGDPDFALPFWDWTNLQEVPQQLYNGVLNPTDPTYQASFETFWAAYGTAINAYYASLSAAQKSGLPTRGINSAGDLQADLQASWNPRAQARGQRVLSAQAKQMCSINTVTQILRSTDFFTFGSYASDTHDGHGGTGTLEGQPHNNVHISVGTPHGFMGAYMSPVDPVFWLHHANVDRLWWLWQQRNPATRGLPTVDQGLSRWLAEPYRFFFDANGAPAPATAADFISSEALGVTYGPGFDPERRFSIFTSEARFQNRSLGNISGALSPQIAAGAAPSFALRTGREVSLPAQAVPRATLASASQADTNEALIARVSLIPPSEAKRTTIDVFINCRYLSPTTPLDDPHYLGTIAFFGARHGAGHSGHGAEKPVDYVLPLNQTLVNLAAAGKPVQGAIRVQLRASAPGGGGQELDARLVGVTIGG